MILLSTPVNIYYVTGRVFSGYVCLTDDNQSLLFVQRPLDVETNDHIIPIRKVEDIPGLLAERGIDLPSSLALELDALTYNEVLRIRKAFSVQELENASLIMRRRRMIKTETEIEQLRISADIHMEVYREVPRLFRKGMRDIDFQIEIEHLMRKKGSIGLFRTFGSNMDIYMGNLLSGDNAALGSPFDFALGGGGVHPSLPIGASGELIKEGTSISVDMAGNYTAYLSDMTRVFSYGMLPDIAYKAHALSLEMHSRFKKEVKAGTSCAEIYNWTLAMAEKAGLQDYFMGANQKAKFVGHGVGLEINELPVLMARSKDFLEENMTIAYEPKFVIPKVGAVGIENTYLIKKEIVENLTSLDEEIQNLI
ncbi:Xaa-Pro peptidase family protein [Bacteroidales bacterium OttesenSCG-928-M11]|nr:Xaa-Pro peptidase family protein [Bacteroidales bacterium OttesenSCG-928-M11]